MKNSVVIALCGVLFCAVSALQAQQPQQAQQSQPRALLIGVVDMPSVLQAHPITVDEMPILRDSFAKERLEAQKYEQTCMKQVEQIKQQYKMGTPQFDEAAKPIREGLRQAEIQLQDRQAEVMNQVNQLQYKIYTDVQKAVQQVAERKGILIVHTKIKLDRKGVAEEVAAVQEADANPTLVWNHPACDITEDVKAALAVIAGTPKGNAANGGALDNISSQAQASAAQPAAAQPAAKTAAASAAAQPARGAAQPR
ncbi:MAG: OmpH family outer membrane protein [Thermoguttaceae bacterium]|nr:OmpH family outer membrane protein [Thermoguttaceae bacterium]